MEPEHTEPLPEQSPPAFTPLTSVQTTPVAGYDDSGWSWGAFLTGPIFVIAIRKYVYLWPYALFFIPFVNVIAFVGVAVYLGLKGRELARSSSTFASPQEYIGFMKGIDHGSKVLGILQIVFVGLFILFSLFGLAMFATAF